MTPSLQMNRPQRKSANEASVNAANELSAAARKYFQSRVHESEALSRAAPFAPLQKSFAAMAERYRILAGTAEAPQAASPRPVRVMTR